MSSMTAAGASSSPGRKPASALNIMATIAKAIILRSRRPSRYGSARAIGVSIEVATTKARNGSRMAMPTAARMIPDAVMVTIPVTLLLLVILNGTTAAQTTSTKISTDPASHRPLPTRPAPMSWSTAAAMPMAMTPTSNRRI